ncbi:MAG: SspB family protein [Maritimibacter sp.]
MTPTIDYGNLMHDAMRSLIRKVLEDVAKNGLPGAHHFFISFDTRHEDVELAQWLADRFPDDMTIVMQHWFEDLDVGEDGFGVTLSFGDNPERVFVPYDAIRTFVDPSVEFGLRFESHEDDEDGFEDDEDDGDVDVDALASLPIREPREGDAKPAAKDKDAEVVSLDSFRK